MNKNKKGFTLIELLVVVAIIGLLATLSIVALNNARARARDARRVADVKQIQTALELYYNDNGKYLTGTTMPTVIATGSGASTTYYMNIVPTAPTPFDGDCTASNNSYAYASQLSDRSYTITYCLGSDTGGITKGVNIATPAGIR